MNRETWLETRKHGVVGLTGTIPSPPCCGGVSLTKMLGCVRWELIADMQLKSSFDEYVHGSVGYLEISISWQIRSQPRGMGPTLTVCNHGQHPTGTAKIIFRWTCVDPQLTEIAMALQGFPLLERNVQPPPSQYLHYCAISVLLLFQPISAAA